MGEGLNSIIEGNRERERLAQQESQYSRTRSDNQVDKAADFASKQQEAKYKTESDRYQKRLGLVDARRRAIQAGDYNTARALERTIIELGGQASESGDPGAPDFRTETGPEPTRGPLDIGAARRELYQGAPPGTQANQPFSVPGFGAGGQRNPFAPQALPGTAAAALPPPPAPNAGAQPPVPPPPGPAAPDPGPPPGAAKDEPPPGSAEADLAALNAIESDPEPVEDDGPAPPAPPDATQVAPPGAPQTQQQTPAEAGPNPFDPYVMRTSEIQANNDLQLKPFFQGLTNAAPSRYTDQIDQFGQGLRALHLSPTATLEAGKPWAEQVLGMLRAEQMAEGQSGRALASQAQRQSLQDDRDKKDARGVARDLIRDTNLRKTNEKLAATREAGMLTEKAKTNGSVGNALIESLYKMRNTGVMTDVDFSRTEQGVQSLYGAIVNNTLKQFIDDNGGLHPGMVRRIEELIKLTGEAHRATQMDTVGSLTRAYRGARSRVARDVYGETIKNNFPEEFWPEELTAKNRNQAADAQLPTYDREQTGDFDTTDEPQIDPYEADPTEGPPPLGDDNLGVVPLPKEPDRAGAVRGSRVPPKPPRKPQKQAAPFDPANPNIPIEKMTPEQRRARVEYLSKKAREP
jgi:hypothetical protein